MNQINQTILGLIALHCGCLTLFIGPASAQSFSSLETTKQAAAIPLEFNNDSAPSGFDGQGRPRSRTSGGSRGGCSDLLVALLPGSEIVLPTDDATACNLASPSHLATTLDSHPTLWFHIPAQAHTEVMAELVLLDNNQQFLSRKTVTLPMAGGIVGVQTSHALTTDQVYHWIFSVLSAPSSPSQNPTVEGSLQRIVASSNLSTTLAAAPDEFARIQTLAQHGVWHDTLHGLALLYRANPNDSHLQDNWFTLLNSVGLGEMAKQVPMDCCID